MGFFDYAQNDSKKYKLIKKVNMKYYVNKINQHLNGLKPLKEGDYYVGLFSQCETKAEGYFAGYYNNQPNIVGRRLFIEA